jgi:molybdopterin converting factor small subunit
MMWENQQQLPLLYPAISARGIVMAVAVNCKTAKENSAINDFDEIALLPPISGG